jgi:hypothetical protein
MQTRRVCYDHGARKLVLRRTTSVNVGGETTGRRAHQPHGAFVVAKLLVETPTVSSRLVKPVVSDSVVATARDEQSDKGEMYIDYLIVMRISLSQNHCNRSSNLQQEEPVRVSIDQLGYVSKALVTPTPTYQSSS